ncbi:MAG: hypothetical protein IJE78_05605 [Bacteroidaceae bacterium]|nr:hypothetical protein [Bacteroidaceae bacterium]
MVTSTSRKYHIRENIYENFMRLTNSVILTPNKWVKLDVPVSFLLEVDQLLYAIAAHYSNTRQVSYPVNAQIQDKHLFVRSNLPTPVAINAVTWRYIQEGGEVNVVLAHPRKDV